MSVFRTLLVASSLLSVSCAQSVEVGDDTGRTEEARDDLLDRLAHDIGGAWLACSAGNQAPFKVVFTYEAERRGRFVVQGSNDGSAPERLLPQSGNYYFLDLLPDDQAELSLNSSLQFGTLLRYLIRDEVITVTLGVAANVIIFKRDVGQPTCSPTVP